MIDSFLKKHKLKKSSVMIILICIILILTSIIIGISVDKTEHEEVDDDYKVVGYITSWNFKGLPDATKLTHLIYCFAEIDTETHLLTVPQTNYLKQLSTLKEVNANLKIMVSLGGGGGDGFSQAAETEQSRKIFADEVLRIIEEYDLDGVDIDWESPVNGGWGTIAALPEDKENCTKLVKQIKETIGKDKILSFATASTNSYSKWVELEKLNDYVDFFNLMSYCYSVGADGCHDANLYNSEFSAMGGISVEYGVNMLIKNGVDKEKIVVGVPFFAYKGSRSLKQNTLAELLESGDYVKMWDEQGKAPYLTTEGSTKIIVTYDNPESIKHKADFVIENKLGGIMCWEIGHDDDDYTLLNAVAQSLKIN